MPKPKTKRKNPLLAIATASGRDLRTIERYRLRGMPTSNAKLALKWIEDNIRQEIGQPTLGEREAGIESRGQTSDVGELEVQELRAKIRKLDAEAQAKELKNAQVRGELYPAEEVERDVAELTSLIRCRLESIPDELHTEWPLEFRQSVTQRLKEKIDLILTQMSSWRLSSWNETETGDSESEAESSASVDSLEPGEHTDA